MVDGQGVRVIGAHRKPTGATRTGTCFDAHFSLRNSTSLFVRISAFVSWYLDGAFRVVVTVTTGQALIRKTEPRNSA